jgi:hypothetical protein
MNHRLGQHIFHAPTYPSDTYPVLSCQNRPIKPIDRWSDIWCLPSCCSPDAMVIIISHKLYAILSQLFEEELTQQPEVVWHLFL